MANDLRDIHDLDRVLHEPARRVIAALLYPVASADFVFLLRETGLSKGNLASHLAKLEAAGYIVVTKGYEGRVPHTDYALTQDGRAAFSSYRERMRSALDKLPG